GPLRGGAFGSQPGKIRVLGRGGGAAGGGGEARTKDAGKDSTASKAPKRRAPVINLAAMPEAKQPPAPTGANEPPAQKPEIRLSKDVIAGHKQGMKASLEALQAQEEKKEKKAPAS